MEITVKELLELAPQISNNQNIKIDGPQIITIRAKTKKDSDVLLKTIEIDYGESGASIDKLGVYNCGGLRIWVVKE